MASPSLTMLTKLRSFFTNQSVLKTVSSIDAYLLPSTDAHQNEYLAEKDFRVKFLSGFSGSNAFTLITKDKALLWTDGRYFIQANQEMGEGWELMKQALPESITPSEWIVQNLASGATVGFDPDIYTYDDAITLKGELTRVGIKVVPIEGNLVDPFWDNRPQLPNKKLICLSVEETGESIDCKIKRIREKISKKKASSIVLLSLDDIMWTLNIRGGDIAYNPLAYSVLFINEQEVHFFIDDVKLTDSSRSHLSPFVTIHPYDDATPFLNKFASSLEGKEHTVFIPSSTNYTIGALFEDRMVTGTSPVQAMKSKKNNVELTGIRKASTRDSLTLARFFYWLENQVLSGGSLTEEEAGKKIDEMRAKSGENEPQDLFVDLSFTTISAVGPHAALPHYHPSNGSGKVALSQESVYLVDSGAHYRDGTTDVTRTVWFGDHVPEKFKRHNTLVLISHIDMALTIFPNGTNGFRLDVAARQAIWKEGLDFGHGVGHGVGHFLNVHETPGISFRKYSTESTIYDGTVITIEPGLYIEGAYGIRIENVYEVVKAEGLSTSDVFLTFKPLTLVPIQKDILDMSLLEERHKKWLNSYHSTVLSALSSEISSSTSNWDKEGVLKWLNKACAPI